MREVAFFMFFGAFACGFFGLIKYIIVFFYNFLQKICSFLFKITKAAV